jgi:hypothetical protein
MLAGKKEKGDGVQGCPLPRKNAAALQSPCQAHAGLVRRPGELRGGSWNNNQINARAAYRNRNNPNNRNNNIGFRVLRPCFSALLLVSHAARRTGSECGMAPARACESRPATRGSGNARRAIAAPR